jgi:hypothetical protein
MVTSRILGTHWKGEKLGNLRIMRVMNRLPVFRYPKAVHVTILAT